MVAMSAAMLQKLSPGATVHSVGPPEVAGGGVVAGAGDGGAVVGGAVVGGVVVGGVVVVVVVVVVVAVVEVDSSGEGGAVGSTAGAMVVVVVVVVAVVVVVDAVVGAVEGAVAASVEAGSAVPVDCGALLDTGSPLEHAASAPTIAPMAIKTPSDVMHRLRSTGANVPRIRAERHGKVC
jgi:hypothetical protein